VRRAERPLRIDWFWVAAQAAVLWAIYVVGLSYLDRWVDEIRRLQNDLAELRRTSDEALCDQPVPD
jgi:hypothetical protein